MVRFYQSLFVSASEMILHQHSLWRSIQRTTGILLWKLIRKRLCTPASFVLDESTFDFSASIGRKERLRWIEDDLFTSVFPRDDIRWLFDWWVMSKSFLSLVFCVPSRVIFSLVFQSFDICWSLEYLAIQHYCLRFVHFFPTTIILTPSRCIFEYQILFERWAK